MDLGFIWIDDSQSGTEVEGVLKDYIKNLENMDIMSKIFDFDEETNILRAMLNLNLNNN